MVHVDTPVLVCFLALRMECSGTLELFEECLLAQSALAKANLESHKQPVAMI